MATNESSKPSVLIVGGLGYIGRYLAKYIHDNKLASNVRLVDKALPQLAHLAPDFDEACASKYFVQADASREASMPRIFEHPAGPDTVWDYVFNLAGETSMSQATEIYKLRSLQLSITLGKEAAKRRVKAFVEVSTGAVYASNKIPRTEQDKLKPWQKIAKVKLEAEQELSKIPGLNLIILRTAHVYGEYDWKWLAKSLCLGRVYEDMQAELKWLYTEEVRANTVHVQDVARALWAAAEWRKDNSTVTPSSPTSPRRPTIGSKGEEGPSGNVPVFNIVDRGQTCIGTLATNISQIMKCQCAFAGTLLSQFARLNLDNVVEDINEECLQHWADMLEAKGITKPIPLNPFLDKDTLTDNHMSLDGSLFEKTVGFQYEYESLTPEMMKEIIASYERMGWWP